MVVCIKENMPKKIICFLVVFIFLSFSNYFAKGIVNTSHLDHLYELINANGSKLGIIHIYSEYPDYKWVGDEDEGISCVDDVARAAIFYIQHYKYLNDRGSFNKAKTLIDAFLAYDPNLKIILQIPSLTGTTGEAWEIDWGGVLDQDLFIANVHKYWVSFIHEFANGAYKSRVDCNYAPIFLNRTTGYAETANSWVHPNQSGYEQLGIGMALAFNKLLNAD